MPLDRLLPNDKQSFYRFDGSLTTPGCFETVTWTVLQDTVKISQDQVIILSASLKKHQFIVPWQPVFCDVLKFV